MILKYEENNHETRESFRILNILLWNIILSSKIMTKFSLCLWIRAKPFSLKLNVALFISVVLILSDHIIKIR